MHLKPITAITVLLLVVTSLSVAGCTTGAKDYSDSYNKAFSDVGVEKQFYKTTSDQGNEQYIGVIQMPGEQHGMTVVAEHVASQDAAAQLYKDAVATAKADGYVARAFNTSVNSTKTEIIERWQGNRGTYSYFYTSYYYRSDLNSWIFWKEYF